MNISGKEHFKNFQKQRANGKACFGATSISIEEMYLSPWDSPK